MSQELTELQDAVAALSAQVSSLRTQVAGLSDQIAALRPELDEETVQVIAAAVSAYLGNRARIKQVHFHTGRAWAQAGRSEIQRRQVPNTY